MASVMDGVNRLTQLAGHNRLELLTFSLGDSHRYGINVFKVQEVIHCPSLTHIPMSNPVIRGVASIRGKTIPVIDLAMAVGKKAQTSTDGCFIIVTEYNRKIQGFLVSAVDQIVNKNWADITPPPKGLGASCYLTAVTNIDDKFVEIIDVEKVLCEITGEEIELSSESLKSGQENDFSNVLILAADDSAVARNQIKKPLLQLGVELVMAKNGREALDILNEWKVSDPDRLARLALVISDVEMPEMDGYTLTAEIRRDPDLKDLYIILHTSLSGVFNNAMTERVGANKFLPKYDPEVLTKAVLERIEERIPQPAIAV